ncbi:MAG: exopolysaccharide biosynthesis protein [Alphaproteobacteria bacterium]|jgi:hypothetical protein|nr:exopolysaccharide biosynthesis protein [Alphaproteobacteria bacterium]
MADVYNLQTLLRSLAENTQGESVTVRDLLGAVGRRSYGPILLLLGFIAISPLTIIPGANWLVALIILIISLQILIGREFPWVPRRIQDFEFKRKYLTDGIETGEKYARHIDRWLKPRFTFLTEPPFAQLIALICIGAALISFPLGLIVLGPFLPGLAVLLFGLGLAARDGLVIALSGAALAGSVMLMFRVIPRIIEIFSAILA